MSIVVFVCIAVLYTLVTGLLAIIQYPEGPVTGISAQNFGSPQSVYKRMLSCSLHSQLLLHVYHVALLN
jgi:hypothetical protein